ncbi:MAG: hypothetical protein WBA97_05005 [Actinophytocola sp.]|uniref:hypothetical protein n=1 Tax=Actinophytocola sp. TaxID=1872138 RepID=UPI003C74E352
MTIQAIEDEVREAREATAHLLPARDFTKPGPHPMSLTDAMNKIRCEYGEAIKLLGKL